tara:strand:+ start:955 stop:1869 length:915 start_codon:yes stop_codon:yes gene_type:complete
MKKKYLIFGGSGFIGSEIVKLAKTQNEITVLSQGKHQNFKKFDQEGLEFYKLKYTKKEISKIFFKKNFDSVFILNGNPYPAFSEKRLKLDIKFTIDPLINILNLLKDINFKGSIWYSSSVAVYGESKKNKLSEGDLPRPISPYGIAKLAAENYCKFFTKKYGLNIGILRLFSTFGPNLKRQVIFDLFQKMKKNPKSLSLLSKKGDARDFSYVTDVAKAILYLDTKHSPNGDVINIGSGKAIKIIDVAKIIASEISYSGIINEERTSRRFIDGASWCADVKLLKKFGFKHSYSFEEGIKNTIEKW